MHRVPARLIAAPIAAACLLTAGGVAAQATTRSGAVTKPASKTKPTTKQKSAPKQKTPTKVKPSTVYIRFQLSEQYTHTQPKTNSNWGYTSSIDEIQQAQTTDLTHDATLGGYRINSSSITAQLTSGKQQCNWSGAINPAAGEAPNINIQRIGNTSYGEAQWPVITGLQWNQKLAAGSAGGCPTQAEFSPLVGSSVSAAPSVPSSFNNAAHFFSAVFPIPKQTNGVATIPVTMSTSGNVPNETDQTSAKGTITIAWGRCPPGVVPCTPTNG